MRASTIFALIGSAIMVSGAAIPVEQKRDAVAYAVPSEQMDQLTKILGSIVGNGNGNKDNGIGNGNKDNGNGNGSGNKDNGNGNAIGNPGSGNKDNGNGNSIGNGFGKGAGAGAGSGNGNGNQAGNGNTFGNGNDLGSLDLGGILNGSGNVRPVINIILLRSENEVAKLT
ncbi:unnamed protein product [Zymoseptoria tritici ST99CH_3D7]|uniref:Uncharacterized protein n=2 Tax=Zymoseptoria tritici TaxID=1047171 RepID=A0A1X7RGX4_ZYMT9|nr:unnamed protein product [Zymoseptoria tritici ST99CH_3D7]